MLKTYYRLAKPGIVYGNLLPAIGAYFLASNKSIDGTVLAGLIFGLSLIIGGSCVINNIFDAKIDARMKRTKLRAIPTRVVSKSAAALYAAALLSVGSLLLLLFTNTLTWIIAFTGVIFYAFIYTFAKRKTIHSTLIGSIPGAIPPVVGYASVQNTLDGTALLLFASLVFWQMPHFYAIALYRSKDYSSVRIPTLPHVKGIIRTKIEILLYILLFTASLALLVITQQMGYLFAISMSLACIIWIKMALSGFSGLRPTELWARQLFKASLFVLLAYSFAIALSPWTA